MDTMSTNNASSILAEQLVERLRTNNYPGFIELLQSYSYEECHRVLVSYLNVAFTSDSTHDTFARWVVSERHAHSGYCWAILVTIEDLDYSRVWEAPTDALHEGLYGLAAAIAADPDGCARLSVATATAA